jgi:hypothetical protein
MRPAPERESRDRARPAAAGALQDASLICLMRPEPATSLLSFGFP